MKLFNVLFFAAIFAMQVPTAKAFEYTAPSGCILVIMLDRTVIIPLATDDACKAAMEGFHKEGWQNSRMRCIDQYTGKMFTLDDSQ